MIPLMAARRSASLDRPLFWVIAWRFLRGRRSRLVDGTARAALAATALGVCAMIIAMALMTGYRRDLAGKLIGGNSALIAQPVSPDAGPLPEATVERLAAVPGVTGVGRVTYGRGALSTEAGHERGGREVVLRGVEAGGRQLGAGAEQLAGEGGVAGVVLGSELARRLEVGQGDLLRLVALGFEDERPRFRYRSLRVTGTFDSGFSEFDAEWAVLDRELVEELMGSAGVLDLYEFTLEEPEAVGPIAEEVRRTLGAEWLVTDWRELNRELFTALEVQQLALFLVLGLIVLVSTFNVASTLVVLVRERMRDIGVLGALGLSPRRLRNLFLVYGGALGAVGIALGVAVGAGSAWILDRWEVIRFDPQVADIYFIRSVPFAVEPVDVLAVVAFSLVVTLAACLLPAWRAARVDPSAALRYE